MKTPVLGGHYVASSIVAADNRLINLYPEAVPEGGKEPGFLTRVPGYDLVTAIGVGPIRGLHKIGDKGFAVSGSKLYSFDASYNVTELGTVTGSGPVSMADNGTQLFIACNPDGFIYNNGTGVFQQITDPDFPGAVSVRFLDGYFVFNEPDSQKVWVTSLLDGTAIDPLEFASAEGLPDNLSTLEVDHREVWLFGTNSVEVWYNSGNLDFPLTRIQGAFIELGCSAPRSVAKLDNALLWLGSDNRGFGVVYRADGYSGIRISDHSIESAIQGFTVISDAIAFSYQQNGHAFYVLSFPTEGRAFAYDMATAEWHERAGFLAGKFSQYEPSYQLAFNNTLLVGSYYNNKVYKFNLDAYTHAGETQKWLRSWRALPTGQNDLSRVIHHQLQLDCQAGVGLNSGQGLDAEVMLRWSDDGGETWSNEHWESLGKLGKYLKRVLWRRLGMTRDRIYELSGTDPVQITIMGAELKATKAGS